MLRLLGDFALEHDGRPCEPAYGKSRALLAYLAVESDRAHPRASLAALFWPDLEHGAALANLRLVLHDLRQVLRQDGAAPLLHIGRNTLRLDPTGLDLDVAAFTAPAPTCPSTPGPLHCSHCLAQMEACAARFRGEFMAGCTLADCPEFESWLEVQREAMHLRALVLLTRLADCHERFGHHDQSLSHALHFQHLEPWNEVGLRRVMRLQAQNGQRAAALEAFDACRRALARELGVRPGADTLELAERIRRGDWPPAVEPGAGAPRTPASLPATVGRRQITVLSCELECPGGDDPDVSLAWLNDVEARCMACCRAHGGHIVQAFGGSFLAYFGYPQAREDAARRAVSAGLALTRIPPPGIGARLGVHTGMTVSGSDPQVPDTLGAASGAATRLSRLADCGTVLLSAATRRLVAGYFECESLGARPLGGSQAQEVFRVDGASGAQDRLETAPALTPLIGRQEELQLLLALWREVGRGALRIVLLRGEAGIGKSRLVRELGAVLIGEEHAVREMRCFPEHSRTPYFPLTAMLAATLGFADGDTPAARFDKLAAYIEMHHDDAAPETVSHFAALLELPLRAPYHAPTAAPAQQRKLIKTFLLDRLYALCARQPVLVVVEDLHWADPSTLELLTHFIAQSRQVPLLLVMTARSGFQPPWPAQAVPVRELQSLDDILTAELIAALAPALGPVTVRRMVDRADGIPLFAEELALESVQHELATIPSSLQDLLAARLDGLGEARGVVQAAATIGRKFDAELLLTVSRLDAAALAHQLRALEEANLILCEGRKSYHFKHALVAEAAYQSQTREERQAAHRRIAAALQDGGRAVRPELLAWHWAAGGETVAAIACWSGAGALALRHSACREALTHYQAGLALIPVLPEGTERTHLELGLRIGLGAAACAAEGYASPTGAAAYARAMALCDEHEGSPDLFSSIWGLWASASSRDGYAAALALAQKLHRIAAPGNDPVLKQQAHFALGDTLYWQGDFPAALKHLEHIGKLYQPCHHLSHVTGFGEDAGVTGYAYRAWVLWFLGQPEQARRACAQSLTLARQLEHPYSTAYALTFAALLACRLRLPEAALNLARETRVLAESHGYALWQLGARLAEGWALAQQGETAGLELIRACIEATRAAMGGVTLAVLEPCVDACLLAGQHEAARALADEALALGRALGDGHVEAELRRLRGVALLGAGDAAQAEASFGQALSIARRQQARALELRAATSLARLWEGRKRADARRLLAGVLRQFDEGFDTPDLLEAGTLLERLSPTPRG